MAHIILYLSPRARGLTSETTFLGFLVHGFKVSSIGWVLPPLSNSWMITIIWLYIALNKAPNIDCYWVGAVPKV